MKKIIFENDYHGFESISDIERDICEALNPNFNDKARDIPGEFSGTIRLTMEYIDES